jgi:hypothetical protein
MLAESGLLGDLQRYSHSHDGQPLCVYGDPAYPISVHMQRSFKGPQLTPLQKEYNAAMSRVRVSVEWVFGDIANYFAFLDFKKNLKVLSGKCTWFVHYLQMPEHAFTSQ